VILIISGLITLMAQGVPAMAQSVRDYVGASECSDCHRSLSRDHRETPHALTLRESDDDGALLASFEGGEQARTVQFPGEDAPRPFTADDVAFVVGTGQYVQRYLYEVEDEGYRVLPAEWDVQARAWRRLELAASWDDPAYNWETSCAACHVTGFDVERGRWEDDGVQCEACHGPGEDHLDAVDEGGNNPSDEELALIRSSINDGIDPQICGACHSVGAGPNGEPFPVGYFPGGDLASVFTLVATDQADHWWATGHARITNMQYNEWVASGHAQSLVNILDDPNVDDSCLSCHSADYTYTARLIDVFEDEEREGDAPEMPTTETAQFGVTCTSCHNPHAEPIPVEEQRAATYTLCVSCHSNENIEEGVHHPVREMFEGTAFIDGILPRVGVHFTTENGPTCTTCHAATVPVNAGERVSHALQPILPGAALNVSELVDNCSSCHEEQASPELLQQLIDDIQSHTRQRIDTARAAVTDSTPAWVTTALDFVEGDGSLGLHNYAYSDAVLDAVYTALNLYPTPEP
jgi:predicted CXXCH cytochrome family protein